MANSSHAQQRARVDRVVLVDEKGVEQLVVAGDAMNLAERQVLVLEGVVVDTSAAGLAGQPPWSLR